MGFAESVTWSDLGRVELLLASEQWSPEPIRGCISFNNPLFPNRHDKEILFACFPARTSHGESTQKMLRRRGFQPCQIDGEPPCFRESEELPSKREP